MKHLILGSALIALGLWGLLTWWESFGLAMRALVPLTALVLGLLAVLSSYYRIGATSAAPSGSLEDAEED